MPPIIDPITGVYMIRHKITGKVYIGSTARKMGFPERFRHHLSELRRGVHHSRYLQRAWNKYGEKAFEFVIIQKCIPDLCLKREQFWMEYYKATDLKFGYNICPVAGNCLGCKHTEETKAKVAAASTGRKQSPEAIEKSAS